MSFIPFALKPEEGELLISYLYRLAQYNELGSLSVLLNTYLHTDSSAAHRNKMSVTKDANTEFGPFFQEEPHCIDLIGFYLNHSIYGGIAPLMNKGNQMQMINAAFRDDFPELNPPLSSSIRTLKICPECRKEDVSEYGFYYYHHEHHMPGVSVCWKHGCALMEHKGSYIHLNDEKAGFVPLNVENLKWERKYAEFAEEFLRAGIDADLSETAAAVFRRMEDLGMRNKPEAVGKMAEENHASQLTHQNIEHFFRISMISPQYVDKPALLAVILLLFETAECFAEYISAVQDNADVKEFFTRAGQYYSIYLPFRKTILEMKKNSNGERFITTVTGFNTGWREASADAGKTAEVKFQEMFENVTDGTYSLISKLHGMNKPVQIKHEKCGKTIRPRVRAFLVEGSRCSCENEISFEQAAVITEQRPGFHLVKYSGTDHICTIHHDACGHDFKCRFSKFRKFPSCRYCESQKKYDAESYREKVHSLVGDEYTVIALDGNAVGTAVIRHNKCGKTERYRADRFLKGQRCHYCTPMRTESEIREIVSSISRGRYSLERRIDDTAYEILDHTDGTSRVMDYPYILQELARPTPSFILPLEQRGCMPDSQKIQDRVFAYISSVYAPDSPIFLEDIKIDSMTYPEVKRAAQSLAERRKLYRISGGVYAMTSLEITPQQLIREKYICRRGRTIGFLCGESLAAELGILAAEPDRICITTNKEAGTHGRNITVMGVKVRIKGSDILIMDSNAAILQVLDILKMQYHKGWDASDNLLDFIKQKNLTREDFALYEENIPEHIRRLLDSLFADIEEQSDGQKSNRKAENT